MTAWRRGAFGSGQKFGNKKTACKRNHSHRSGLESSVCDLLLCLEIAGEIKLLQTEDHVYLTEARILYIPDFKIQLIGTDEIQWVEAKGFETPEWRIKLRLWRHYGPGKLNIYRGSAKKNFLQEVVIPKGIGANAVE